MSQAKTDKDVAITVSHVSKDFLLPHQRTGTVKSMFTGIFQSRNRRLEKQHALHDVNFTIDTGEFFGILGRNGSGKSTLLKILAGIYTPTEGSVKTVGKLVPFIELGVGFDPELTGRENVYLNGALLGFSTKEIDRQYHKIVEFAELERFMDQKLKNYSSGMQVRLAFSMAVRAEADILLVDEVLAVGDADFQRKCYQYFKSLKKNKTTVVFVSHDMDAVREFCDRAILIDKSRIIHTGKGSAVAEQYSRLFIEGGDNNKNKADNETEGDQDRWGDGTLITTDVFVDVTEKQIKIHQTIKAAKAVDEPIPGFRLRNSAGQELLGTNTKVEEVDLPSLAKGDSLTVEWCFDNSLNDGGYIVDPAIVYNGGVSVADWWNGGVEFTVKKVKRTPYLLAPSITTKVILAADKN